MSVNYGAYDHNNIGPDPRRTTIKVLAVFVAIVVVVALGLLAIHTLRSRPPKIQIPTSFKVLSATDGAYKIDVPSTWWAQTNCNDSQTTCTERVATRGAVIIIKDDQLSAQAAPTQTTTDDGTQDQDFGQGASQGFTRRRGGAGRQTPQFIGGTQTLDTPLGTAALSEFTLAPRGRLVRWPMHGYRETITTPTHSVTVNCVGPDTNWNDLQPAFWHVVNSISPGTT